MSTFQVNGQTVTPEKNKSLLRFLRDDLHITSAKDGCSEGACGACTVIINGETVRACTVKTYELDGASVLTVEGLSEREKKIFTYAFGEAGAVQCGFCIPGMVMCGKALIDKNPDPTEEEIRHAIRHNICRCTGYVKIVAAIRLAARIQREHIENPRAAEDRWHVDARVHKVDTEEKVLGYGLYPDDIYLPGMCVGSPIFAGYPRARLLAVHKEEAEALPGVVCVLTRDDIPGTNDIGHLFKDQPAMIPIGEMTRSLGDVVALVAAKDPETLNKAKALVKIDYEELPGAFNSDEAAREDAPLVVSGHQNNVLVEKHVNRGDAEEAIRRSAYVIHDNFYTPWTEHAFLEPECAVAYPMENGGVHIISTDQNAHQTQRECAALLGLDNEHCVVENALVGGGFGGKEDESVQHLAALIAYRAHVPVKVKLTRQESLQMHPKRHEFEMDFTMGCDEKGIIQGVVGKVKTDNGGFASLGGPVLERACTHASGPYHYHNFKVDGIAYYTNNPPAGAFRGFGVTQTLFAVETLLNRMADKVGISHWEIRYRNAIRPGEELPNGQIVDEATGLVETLEAVKPYYDEAVANGDPVGIACALKNAGVGVGIPDTGRCRLVVEKDGRVHIYCGASDIGQGFHTVAVQIVCDKTGLPREKVAHERSHTGKAPDSGVTSGSRQTLVSGEAVRRAAAQLADALREMSLDELVGQEFYAEYLAKTDPMGAPVPNPVSHVAYGYATDLCILDKNTGRIKKIIAAHDVGVAVNPTNCEGQIEGGVVMGMGYALTERFPLEKGKVMAKYAGLGLLRADELPEIIPLVVEKKGLKVACGAKGIGEITSIPVAPAINDAYLSYDGQERSSLPLVNTPYEYHKPEPLVRKKPGKTLAVRRDRRCIGCRECVRACAMAMYKTDDADKACLKIVEKKGNPTPSVCIQCGKCEKACPEGAITQNARGVYIINKKKCTGCGLCRKACPLDVMVDGGSVTSKCIACGICVRACPMNVLGIAEGEEEQTEKAKG